MWIGDGLLRRPPPKPDWRFSRIRLSRAWPPMNWLRHSTQGFQKSRTSRAGSRPAHLDSRRFTVGLAAGSKQALANASVRRALRHYTDPCGMESHCGPTPRPYPPSLHGHYPFLRYYEGSDPGRPFRHRPWFPDSRHPNFRTFHLQSSADLRQPRSTPSALAALFCCGLRRGYAVSPVPPTESSSLCSLCGESLLRTARSFPVALHPGLWPRRSYFQLLAFQCRPGQGLSPCCSGALSGAHSPALQRRDWSLDIISPLISVRLLGARQDSPLYSTREARRACLRRQRRHSYQPRATPWVYGPKTILSAESAIHRVQDSGLVMRLERAFSPLALFRT